METSMGQPSLVVPCSIAPALCAVHFWNCALLLVCVYKLVSIQKIKRIERDGKKKGRGRKMQAGIYCMSHEEKRKANVSSNFLLKLS